MTKKLPLDERLNRRPISRACNFCHQKHLQCDHGRPCKNCVKRGLESTCQDVKRKRAKYLSEEPSSAESSAEERSQKRKQSSTSISPEMTRHSSTSTVVPSIENKFQPILPANNLIHPTDQKLLIPDSPTIDQQTNYQHNSQTDFEPDNDHTACLDRKDSATPHIARLIDESHSDYPQQTPSPHKDVFSSLFANEEYSQLTDILDKSGVGGDTPLSSGGHGVGGNAIYNNEFQTSFQTDNNTRPYISLSDNSTNTHQSLPNLMLTSNDEDYTSPLIIRHMITVPEDVYTTQIQSYNYPKAYHALLNYLKTRFNKEQLIKIAEFMADYRPSFIAATRSLVEMDLLFAERSFQRSLLEYESMSSLSSSPTIMWRRTGEIVAVSSEFSSLTSHTKAQLLSKRTFIIELMNESSALDYFKLFSSVAFGDLNGVIITECTLLSPNGEPIRCASTWTVKRDVFDIPMLIVGQFLPILQVR